MRGIQFTSAVGLISELGDMSRFGHPRQFLAQLGVRPSKHSSRRPFGSTFQRMT